MVNAQVYLNQNYPKATRSNVTTLDLSNKNLEGWLSLIDFVNIKLVNFSSNQIDGIDWNFTNSLEVIDGSYNQMIGFVGQPNAISGLKFLNFSHNNLYDKISLCLPNLTNLDISYNGLTDLFIKDSKNLVSLKCLENLRLNNLTLSPNLHLSCAECPALQCENNKLSFGAIALIVIISFTFTAIFFSIFYWLFQKHRNNRNKINNFNNEPQSQIQTFEIDDEIKKKESFRSRLVANAPLIILMNVLATLLATIIAIITLAFKTKKII